jgi:uncharacterized protein (DUF2236 family)
MPVHIDNMTTEATAVEGELPLSEAQLEQLVKRVLERLEAKQRTERALQEMTQFRSTVQRPESYS